MSGQRKVGPRYGLTCGYWSNRPGKVENHVFSHIMAAQEQDLYDVDAEQWNGERLHRCREGIS